MPLYAYNIMYKHLRDKHKRKAHSQVWDETSYMFSTLIIHTNPYFRAKNWQSLPPL